MSTFATILTLLISKMSPFLPAMLLFAVLSIVCIHFNDVAPLLSVPEENPTPVRHQNRRSRRAAVRKGAQDLRAREKVLAREDRLTIKSSDNRLSPVAGHDTEQSYLDPADPRASGLRFTVLPSSAGKNRTAYESVMFWGAYGTVYEDDIEDDVETAVVSGNDGIDHGDQPTEPTSPPLTPDTPDRPPPTFPPVPPSLPPPSDSSSGADDDSDSDDDGAPRLTTAQKGKWVVRIQDPEETDEAGESSGVRNEPAFVQPSTPELTITQTSVDAIQYGWVRPQSVVLVVQTASAAVPIFREIISRFVSTTSDLASAVASLPSAIAALDLGPSEIPLAHAIASLPPAIAALSLGPEDPLSASLAALPPAVAAMSLGLDDMQEEVEMVDVGTAEMMGEGMEWEAGADQMEVDGLDDPVSRPMDTTPDTPVPTMIQSRNFFGRGGSRAGRLPMFPRRSGAPTLHWQPYPPVNANVASTTRCPRNATVQNSISAPVVLIPSTARSTFTVSAPQVSSVVSAMAPPVSSTIQFAAAPCVTVSVPSAGQSTRIVAKAPTRQVVKAPTQTVVQPPPSSSSFSQPVTVPSQTVSTADLTAPPSDTSTQQATTRRIALPRRSRATATSSSLPLPASGPSGTAATDGSTPSGQATQPTGPIDDCRTTTEEENAALHSDANLADHAAKSEKATKDAEAAYQRNKQAAEMEYWKNKALNDQIKRDKAKKARQDKKDKDQKDKDSQGQGQGDGSQPKKKRP